MIQNDQSTFTLSNIAGPILQRKHAHATTLLPFESGVAFNSGNDMALASSQCLSYDDCADSLILVRDIEEGHLQNREIKFDQFGSL
jgi:hypothetical protein